MAFIFRTRRRLGGAELFRMPEMDEEDEREARLEPTRRLFFRIISVADNVFGDDCEPARSRTIVEAECFGVSHIIYHSRTLYSDEARRAKFVDELKSNFALVSAAVAASPKGDLGEVEVLQGGYGSLVDLKEWEYRTVRSSLHSRLCGRGFPHRMHQGCSQRG